MSGIKVKVELEGVNKKVQTIGGEKQNQLLKMVLRDSTPYVPKDTGELRESGGIEGKSVVWDAEYAHDVYTLPKNYKTPGTTHLWLDKAKGIHLKDWLKELERN